MTIQKFMRPCITGTAISFFTLEQLVERLYWKQIKENNINALSEDQVIIRTFKITYLTAVNFKSILLWCYIFLFSILCVDINYKCTLCSYIWLCYYLLIKRNTIIRMQGIYPWNKGLLESHGQLACFAVENQISCINKSSHLE